MFYKRPLMVVKYNTKLLSYSNCKRGSTKGQIWSSSVPMGNAYIPIFFTSPHPTLKDEGMCRGNVRNKNTPHVPRRFPFQIFDFSLPFRVPFLTTKSVHTSAYYYRSSARALLLIPSSKRVHLLSLDWFWKNKTSCTTHSIWPLHKILIFKGLQEWNERNIST